MLSGIYVCSLNFIGLKTLEDLVNLNMVEFDIVLEMSCMYPDHICLNYYSKIVTIVMPEREKLEQKGTFNPNHVCYVYNLCLNFIMEGV